MFLSTGISGHTNLKAKYAQDDLSSCFQRLLSQSGLVVLKEKSTNMSTQTEGTQANQANAQDQSVPGHATPSSATSQPLPDVWERLAPHTRRAFLLLGVQSRGTLYYSNHNLTLFEELERYKLVERTETEADGRLWRITPAGIDLVYALPESEDPRLRWIKQLHRR
jgi:hypothetical protein